MKRIQRITKAKTYLELMARSIDPTTQEIISDPILQKQETRDIFLYVVSLLDELIDNNGEVINVATPIEFQVEKIKKDLISVTEQPIQISGFVRRINKQVDNTKMETFKQSILMEWLLRNGYLAKDKRPVVKDEIVYATTISSQDIGIQEQEKVDVETGEIKKAVVLTKKAQEFIVDNLENIIGLTEEIKLPDFTDIDEEIEMAWQKWTEDEQERLIHEFVDEKLTIEQIAGIHHRKVGGIRARLKKLGMIEDN